MESERLGQPYLRQNAVEVAACRRVRFRMGKTISKVACKTPSSGFMVCRAVSCLCTELISPQSAAPDPFVGSLLQESCWNHHSSSLAPKG